jgi:hypothetical protein
MSTAPTREEGRWHEVYLNIEKLPVDKREEILRSRVAGGIALLNEREWSAPWYFQINLSLLDIADPYYCVLGQLFTEDGYMEGLQALNLSLGILYGFSGVYTEALTIIWREEILKLRENHVQ